MDASFFSAYMLPIVVGLIMYNLGLSLTICDFKQTFAFPKALIIGLCCQMILLPLIAFALASISNLPPEIKVGVVIIAVCPGGATSNLITYLLKGDVALSISLTTVNSILILFTIPGGAYLALQAFLDKEAIIVLPFLPTILKILLMILLPTFLGLLTKMKMPNFSKILEKYMKYITTISLAIVFVFTIFDNNSKTDNSITMYWMTIPFALLLNIIGMFVGYYIGRLANFGTKKLVTLVVEIGIQNSALAITIASSQAFLGNAQMAIPAVTYGMFTFFNAVLFGYIIKKRR